MNGKMNGKMNAESINDMPMMTRTVAVQHDRQRVPLERGRELARERIQLAPERTRNGPEMER